MAGKSVGSIRALPSAATRLIAICGKCGKKLGGGFGADAEMTLAKALRRAVPGAKGKRAEVRIIETKCLDICPKGAIVLLDSNEPGTVVLVPGRTAVSTVAAGLGLLKQS